MPSLTGIEKDYIYPTIFKNSYQTRPTPTAVAQCCHHEKLKTARLDTKKSQILTKSARMLKI